MKITLEQLGRMRERRQKLASQGGLTLDPDRHRWVQPMLLIFGVLFVAAIAADMIKLSRGGSFAQPLESVSVELQQLDHDIAAGRRVTASSGLFSLVLPGGWTVRTGEAVAPYDLTLVSPNRVSVSLSATRVPFDDLPALYKTMGQREREYGVHTEAQPYYLHGIPAARRELELMKTKVLAIDFVKDHIAHQIFCEVPAEVFAQYRPTLLKLIETYQPLSPAAPARKTP